MKNLKTESDEFVVFTKNINKKDGTISKLMTDLSKPLAEKNHVFI